MTPFEYLVWDAGDCAEYLKESRDYFLSHTRYKEGFPSEIPGKPKRWRAAAVAAWKDGGFGLTAGSISALFARYAKEAKVEGLTFHCLRRTAATRLSERLTVLELCAMFGWKDPRIVVKHYYKADPEAIARKLNAPPPQAPDAS